jgi:hypothetical protein
MATITKKHLSDAAVSKLVAKAVKDGYLSKNSVLVHIRHEQGVSVRAQRVWAAFDALKAKGSVPNWREYTKAS